MLHVLEKSLKVIGIDVVPEGFLPGLELTVNDGDKIPHLLQLNELVLAINEFLLLGPLQLEELLEGLELFRLFFHLAGLVKVLTNHLVRIVDILSSSLLFTVWELRLELLSVVENLDLELTHSLLDVVGLLRLQGQDSLLDRA